MSSGMNEVAAVLERRFAREIKAHHVLPAEPGDFAPLPASLHPALRRVLEEDGVSSLYSHQAEAFDAISANRDTVLVSRTASGKTLSFLLPILHEYHNAPAPFSVLFMYPTKALSRDQESTIGRLMAAAADRQKLGVFDGDTPREERRSIQRNADFVITNPDMLHSGVLPNHARFWKGFLARLRYVVVDEVHMYRGAFGSHVANVFRRLLRACEAHGSRPAFVGCSATVGNPGRHVEALFHRPFTVIDKDGAPRPARDLYFINPPLAPSQGGSMYRKGTGSVFVPLIREATDQRVRTICFCRARQQVERLYRAAVDRRPDLRDRIKPYRGGLLPNERRQLERDLFEGRLNTIITTNALELGIDIGDLDLCLLSGHPGTVASFWQQAGRVGRKGSRGVIVFAARDLPVDQYIANHADFITRAPVEQAWLNADNPYILLQHLPCAAHEYPLRPEEPLFDDKAYPMATRVLTNDRTLVPFHDCLRYALQDYPARGVTLRGMTDYNVEIYHGSEVIGEIDPIGARGTLYKDAIYQHLGRRYMSLELDLEKKLCRVDEVDVDYYTEAVWENRLEMTEVDDEKTLETARYRFGLVHVNKQPKLYKKIRERTYENVGYGPITLDAFTYDTTGFALHPPVAWSDALGEVDKRYRDAALYGLRYLIGHSAPSLCMADRNDIASDVSMDHQDATTWESSLFVYDTHEGGVGYAEKIYERIEDALALCKSVIESCPCETGCPACVPPLPPGVENEDLEELLIESDAAVVCTRSLLDALIDGRVAVPNVRFFEHRRGQVVEVMEPDPETVKLDNQLSRASRMLKARREKQH